MTVQADLLPVSVNNRRSVERALITWGVLWVIAGVATFYLCHQHAQHLDRLEATAQAIEAQAKPLNDVRRKAAVMRADIKRIQERESWMTESDSGQTLQLLGIVSQAAGRIEGRLNVESMNLQAFEREIIQPETSKRTDPKSRPKSEQRMKLDLAGHAVDDLAVASFIAGLRDAGVFESVELKSSVSQVREEFETRHYEATCIY